MGEAQRGDYVELVHALLSVDEGADERAGNPETGVVHQQVEILRAAQVRFHAVKISGVGEVGNQDFGIKLARYGFQAIASPRHQQKVVAARRQGTGEGCADSAGRAGDGGERASLWHAFMVGYAKSKRRSSDFGDSPRMVRTASDVSAAASPACSGLPLRVTP